MSLDVCLVSHVYLDKRSRGKLTYLGERVRLTIVSPDAFPTAYGLYRADFSDARNYHARIYPCLFPIGVRTSTRWVLATSDMGYRQAPPDIIHVENEAHSFSLLQTLVYRRLYAPSARLVVFVWANQPLAGAKRPLLNALGRLLRSGVDCFIAGNSEARELLLRDGIPPDRVVVCPLVGIDTGYYRPASVEERRRQRSEMGLGHDDFVIGFVGRFVIDKGIFDLLQAFDLLRAQSRGPAVRLLCVGDGPLNEHLQRRGPQVVTASPGGHGGALPYYRMMDTLVLPSRTMSHWKEQFGLVLVEAMACGVPVIGSDSGAIPEVIGDAGLAFPEGRVHALVEALESLRSSPSRRAEMRERGLRRVVDCYSDRRVAERTLEIYRLLCPDRSAPIGDLAAQAPCAQGPR